MIRGLLSIILALHAGAVAAADPFATRQGESGILDVPDAETAPVAGGRFTAELRADKAPGLYQSVGPLPLSLVTGLSKRLEFGFSMREWGAPGDPRPSPTLFGAAAKLRLTEASGAMPGFAIDLLGDRVNMNGVYASRLIASTALVGRLRFAAYAGAEGHGLRPPSVGPTAGLAATILHRSDLQTALEVAAGPRGALVGGAFRWMLRPNAGVSLGLTWLPAESGFRVSLGVGFGSISKNREPPPEASSDRPSSGTDKSAAAKPGAPLFTDARPRFRMTIHRAASPTETGPRHLQYAMASDAHPVSPAAEPRKAAAVLDPDAQRERELDALAEQLEGRERRLRSADGALANRQERLSADQDRLKKREQKLAAQGAALDARELEIRAPGKGTERELQLAEAEDQIRGSERELAARAREALDAVSDGARREKVAAAREDQLRPDASRPAEARTTSSKQAQQREARAQALGARDAYLAAVEARLALTRDRLEAFEREVRVESDRLDAVERRLSVKQDRLLALERRAHGKLPDAPAVAEAPAAATQRATRTGPASVATIVKPPAALEFLGAGPATSTPLPTRAESSGEKTVLAAAFVALPVAGQAVTLEDRESVANVAKLVAREGGEVVVWARAQSSALIEEASRRAEELKALAVTAGPLSATVVQTRVTIRPSTTGVDVVVSALRSERRAEPPPAGGVEKLQRGETGKRQIRDAVSQYRPEIGGCIEAEIARRGLQRADVLLKLRIDARGRIADLASAQGEVSGPELDACLRRGSVSWRLPATDGEYAVEVPVTAVISGARP